MLQRGAREEGHVREDGSQRGREKGPDPNQAYFVVRVDENRDFVHPVEENTDFVCPTKILQAIYYVNNFMCPADEIMI